MNTKVSDRNLDVLNEDIKDHLSLSEKEAVPLKQNSI